MLCNISQNAMRQRGGYPGQVPPPGGGYLGQVPPRGGYPDPPGGGYPSQVPPPYPIMLCNISQNAMRQRGVPGSGTPPGGGTRTPPGGGYPGRTTEGVLTTRRAVCLLRSRRRTFLFCYILPFLNIIERHFGHWEESYVMVLLVYE